MKSTRPAIRSLIAAAPPRYGTCTTSMPAMYLNSSPPTWPGEPLADDALVSLPGFFLPSSIRSLTDLKSDVGATASSRWPRLISAIGWKSFSDAVGQPRHHVGADRERADRADADACSRPARAFATRSRPMVKAAPGLFSMTIVLVELRPDLGGDQARDRVGRAARRLRHDQPDRLVGITGPAPARRRRHATPRANAASNDRTAHLRNMPPSPTSSSWQRSRRSCDRRNGLRQSSALAQPAADPLHRLAHVGGRAGVAEAQEAAGRAADRSRRRASPRHAPPPACAWRSRSCRW